MDDETRTALERIEKRLDHLEEHVLQMSRFGAQIQFAPMGRADYRPDDPDHVPQEVIDLAQAGKRKEAIVKYRELIGANAEKAIATVDRL
jgi:hypothetical protein